MSENLNQSHAAKCAEEIYPDYKSSWYNDIEEIRRWRYEAQFIAAEQKREAIKQIILRHFSSSPADEGLEEIAEKCWPYIQSKSDLLSALNQAVAKVTKERDEVNDKLRLSESEVILVRSHLSDAIKSVLEARDLIAPNTELSLANGVNQLLRDKEALQKVARELNAALEQDALWGITGDNIPIELKCRYMIGGSLTSGPSNCLKAYEAIKKSHNSYTSLPESIRGKDKE